MGKIKTWVTLILAFCGLTTLTTAQSILPVQQTKTASLRGLSVVNDSIAWVSGSKGSVALTTDGGKTWAWQQVPGFEKSDFRDIEAFSDQNAIIMSSGTPAVILKTVDGGKSWQTKYQQTDSVYFLDAMDFADKQHGFILGDPINGKFLLLTTTNAGETWDVVNNAPTALKNEAAFAASGTCLRIVNNNIKIVTGGSNSRLLSATLDNLNWAVKALPLTNGQASRGAFSVADGKTETIIVGGDYANNTKSDSVAYVIPVKKSVNKGMIPSTGPAGYQSCVEYISGDTYLSTGTSGSNLTADGGRTWKKINTESYNVCCKARHGKLVLFAGDGGKIGIYKP